MKVATLATMWIVRVAGIVQIVLGLLFWTGRALGYIPLHMTVGFVVVLGLWTLAVLALVARTGAGLALFAIVWGLALPALGMTQAAILVGPWHWIIRVIHLLMGLTALGLADQLATRVLKSRAPSGRVARA
jgi:hypothetical protein